VEVDELTDTLESHGYGAQALHGGLDQRQRDRVMQLFRTGKAEVLVATDVAARGLDIEHVSHVVNYDIPTAPEVYVHRIGRTGRIGRDGVAITLVDPREQRTLRYIETVTKQKIEIVALPTLAALKARRLDQTRAALTTRLAAGDLEDMRALIQTLTEEFDTIDIAAAALSMYQAASEAPVEMQPEPESPRPGSRPRSAGGFGDGGARRPPRPDGPGRPLGLRERPARATSPRAGALAGGDAVVVTFSVGRDHGVRPADLVGAITGEAGITSRELGAIRIGANASTVEVSEPIARQVAKAMKGKFIRGEKVDVRIVT
ncbi:MAG: DbpA RNA binding domain-containing protein, partial [Acidobacteria bacterium]|nr:DbpA RNA binding domain-containing protein [Acidobacteriota bacterium]